MKFDSLRIENFRGISRMQIDDLGGMVVLAGPNGCGKSSVLDAIRLLKSTYGGYRRNEIERWLSENQINARRLHEVARLFRNPAEPIVVHATVSLSDSERAFIRTNVQRLAWSTTWRGFNLQSPEQPEWSMPLAPELRAHGKRAERLTEALSDEILDLVDSGPHAIVVSLQADGTFHHDKNGLIETLFQTYDPGNLGVIDYYSAHRQYARETVSGINLGTYEYDERRSQHLLYESQGKHQNIKQELASSYIADLVSQAAGADGVENSLGDSLVSLFEQFFDGKSFGGVRPTPEGKTEFPVVLDDGTEHDIDELSSGEKEILYGYLRLRASNIRNSIVLIDEPEVHLNPRLVRGLAAFYNKHVGIEMGNQLWLITHSDRLLRDALDRPDFSTYHLRLPQKSLGGNQATALSSQSELDSAIFELVGDLPSIAVGAPILVVESSEDVAFDEYVVRQLFPEFVLAVTLVSGGDKTRVRDLYRLVSSSPRIQSQIGSSVAAIIDRDNEFSREPSISVFSWDVYHIENYLLWPTGIASVLTAARPRNPVSAEEVETLLHECAHTVKHRLVLDRLTQLVNKSLVKGVRWGIDPETDDVAAAMFATITREAMGIRERAADFTEERIKHEVASIESDLDDALTSERWKSDFRGRDILRRLCSTDRVPMKYEVFRNLLVAEMARSEFRPAGMESTLREAVPGGWPLEH
ncbi:MAG: ATP-binding protein [Ilumatobacteraceae bacterium]|nr:ATP-binding protein [Ilumatobacteraceae bacterium]